MITENDLRNLARAKLKDSQALYRRGRYDGALYLCGYALEMALKARICRTLKWIGFPETRREFEALVSFKTHDLEVLLHLTGIETKIKSRFPTEWSTVATWNPEMRYRTVGSTGPADAADMIAAAKTLLKAL